MSPLTTENNLEDLRREVSNVVPSVFREATNNISSTNNLLILNDDALETTQMIQTTPDSQTIDSTSAPISLSAEDVAGALLMQLSQTGHPSLDVHSFPYFSALHDSISSHSALQKALSQIQLPTTASQGLQEGHTPVPPQSIFLNEKLYEDPEWFEKDETIPPAERARLALNAPVGLERSAAALKFLLKRTIFGGENTAALLLGPRGEGKSTAVRWALSSIQNDLAKMIERGKDNRQLEEPERRHQPQNPQQLPFIVITLSGIHFADDKLAIIECVRQACEQLFIPNPIPPQASFLEHAKFLALIAAKASRTGLIARSFTLTSSTASASFPSVPIPSSDPQTQASFVSTNVTTPSDSSSSTTSFPPRLAFVFILDEFQEFAQRGLQHNPSSSTVAKQPLLYFLCDMLQGSFCPVTLLALTASLSSFDMLEKRIRSRLPLHTILFPHTVSSEPCAREFISRHFFPSLHNITQLTETIVLPTPTESAVNFAINPNTASQINPNLLNFSIAKSPVVQALLLSVRYSLMNHNVRKFIILSSINGGRSAAWFSSFAILALLIAIRNRYPSPRALLTAVLPFMMAIFSQSKQLSDIQHGNQGRRSRETNGESEEEKYLKQMKQERQAEKQRREKEKLERKARKEMEKKARKEKREREKRELIEMNTKGFEKDCHNELKQVSTHEIDELPSVKRFKVSSDLELVPIVISTPPEKPVLEGFEEHTTNKITQENLLEQEEKIPLTNNLASSLASSFGYAAGSDHPFTSGLSLAQSADLHARSVMGDTERYRKIPKKSIISTQEDLKNKQLKKLKRVIQKQPKPSQFEKSSAVAALRVLFHAGLFSYANRISDIPFITLDSKGLKYLQQQNKLQWPFQQNLMQHKKSSLKPKTDISNLNYPNHPMRDFFEEKSVGPASALSTPILKQRGFIPLTPTAYSTTTNVISASPSVRLMSTPNRAHLFHSVDSAKSFLLSNDKNHTSTQNIPPSTPLLRSYTHQLNTLLCTSSETEKQIHQRNIHNDSLNTPLHSQSRVSTFTMTPLARFQTSKMKSSFPSPRSENDNISNISVTANPFSLSLFGNATFSLSRPVSRSVSRTSSPLRLTSTQSESQPKLTPNSLLLIQPEDFWAAYALLAGHSRWNTVRTIVKQSQTVHNLSSNAKNSSLVPITSSNSINSMIGKEPLDPSPTTDLLLRDLSVLELALVTCMLVLERKSVVPYTFELVYYEYTRFMNHASASNLSNSGTLAGGSSGSAPFAFPKQACFHAFLELLEVGVAVPVYRPADRTSVQTLQAVGVGGATNSTPGAEAETNFMLAKLFQGTRDEKRLRKKLGIPADQPLYAPRNGALSSVTNSQAGTATSIFISEAGEESAFGGAEDVNESISIVRRPLGAGQGAGLGNSNGTRTMPVNAHDFIRLTIDPRECSAFILRGSAHTTSSSEMKGKGKESQESSDLNPELGDETISIPTWLVHWVQSQIISFAH